MNDNHTTSPRDTLRIALGVAGALAGVAIIVILLTVLIHLTQSPTPIPGTLTDQQRYDLLAKTRAEDEKLLTTYGWMDKSKGLVRLPISVAMEEVIQERQ